METLTAAKFRFGSFEMDCSRRSLSCDGQTLVLNQKAFDLLKELVENHGSVVTKDELLERVWPGQFVEENNLTVQISALRKVFGETRNHHRFIVTVPGIGYSFVEAVERVGFAQQMPVNGIDALQVVPAVDFFEAGSIVGRSNEIAEITDILCLDDNGARLMILTGAGGSGKTRLAKAVAGELSSDFPDGVFFVELAAAKNAELLALTVAVALGVEESPETPAAESLKEFLRERRMLLILDNFEQLVSASSFIKDILSSSPELKILVTSRVALRLSNELEFAVLPLSVPPRDVALSTEQLNEYPAITLFVARPQSSDPAFVLQPANAPAVAEICRRLDGLPLALELAAARLNLLSAESILARLENSLKLLTGGSNDLPERQQTIRATIQWSYDLLDEDAKGLIQSLAVFMGGFSVEAAEAVASATLDQLTLLVDSNLFVLRKQADGNARLQMLEVVREFALEYLEKNGEASAIRQNHADFFLDLAEQAEPHLFSGQSVEWLETLDIENDNLRAALEWLLDHEPDKAARMAAALGQFWINRSYLNEARKWLEATLGKSENDLIAARFKLLNTFSMVARNQGDYAATRRASEESLSISRAAKNLPQIILSCHAVAALETREGNFAAAQNLIAEALTISRELGDEKQVAFTLSFLGNLFLAEGKTASARGPIEESLTISRRLGLTVNVSTNLTNLGTLAFYEGDIGSSYRHFVESLKICREMANWILASCCLDGLAAVASSRKKMEQAARLAGAAEAACESVGYEIELTELHFRYSYLAGVEAALGEKTFSGLYAQGKKADLDEVIAGFFKRPLLETGQDYHGDPYSQGDLSEVVIETRSISRVIIEEETFSE